MSHMNKNVACLFEGRCKCRCRPTGICDDRWWSRGVAPWDREVQPSRASLKSTRWRT